MDDTLPWFEKHRFAYIVIPMDRPENASDDTFTLEAETETAPARRGNPFASLRHRDYRYFWMGALVSNVGTWMQNVGVGWVVFDLTRNSDPSLALGVINFLTLIPMTVLTLFAGVIADRFDRKRLIVISQVLLMLQAFVLARLTQVGAATVMIIGALALLGGIFTAFVFPAWQAMMPDIVPKRSLMNAIALNAAQFNGARLLGPLLGGLVFARWGAAEVFYINGVSFLFVIWALALIHPRQERHRPSGQGALATLTAGVRYARENIHIGWMLISAFMLSLLGMPYVTLMPVMAAEVLGRGASGYSMLMAAGGLGAVGGALFVASCPASVGRDLLLRSGLMGMGASLLLFSISRSFYLSLVFVAAAGFSFLVGMSASTTGLQATTPARLRGRVMALFVLCFAGIQPFSALGFGSLGEVIGVPLAIGAGAALLMVYAGYQFLRPGLLRVRDDAVS